MKYILNTLYDNNFSEAFSLIKKEVIAVLNDIRQKEEFGQPQTNSNLYLKKFYNLINYLVKFRQAVFIHIKESDNKCINEADLNALKSKYKLNCIKEENVCNKYTNDLIEIFLKNIPICESIPVYEWSEDDLCDDLDGIIFSIGLSIYKKLNGFIIEEFSVPKAASVEDIEKIIGVSNVEATKLFNTRYTKIDNELCCGEPVYDTPIIQVTNTTDDSISISYESNATNYRVRLLENNIQVSTEETTDKNITFSDLNLGTEYTIEVNALSCASVATNTLDIQTTPIILDISLCGELTSPINIIGPPLGKSNRTYNELIQIGFESTDSPKFEINSVLVNGVDIIDEIVFTVTEGQTKTKGQFEINITENTDVVLCGEIVSVCETISTTYNEGIIINYI